MSTSDQPDESAAAADTIAASAKEGAGDMPAAARRDTAGDDRTARERQLEARIRDLENQLNARRERRRRYMEETREDVRSLSDRKVDEAARLFTGAVRAGLEAIRVVADAASSMVEETLERSIPEPGEDSASVASRLPGDFVRASVHSAQGSLDAPGRAADQFNRAFSKEGGARVETTTGKDSEPSSGAS